jgi:hypothetical protein
VQQSLQNPAHEPDFLDRLDVWQVAFDLVKDHQEHPVLRSQALKNSHVEKSNAAP